MEKEFITIRGARQHNLKNLTLKIPRNQLVVITGLSGSGKSSLAFDTIYAEGQRRYVESLSAYARQFLELMQKPDVDLIEGLSPAIAIEQRTPSHNPRSTVGTVTEIYDYLRLLFARIGKPHCPQCGREIKPQSAQQIIDEIIKLPAGTKIQVLAPLIQGRIGTYEELFKRLRQSGFARVRVNGRIFELEEDIKLERYKKHKIDLVVDRLVMGSDIRERLADSVETALRESRGLVLVSAQFSNGSPPPLRGRTEVGGGVASDEPPHPNLPPQGGKGNSEHLYSEHHACTHCGTSLPEIEPRMFSFNSPYGACPTCDGLGTKLEVDPDLVVVNPHLSIGEGAIEAWSNPVTTRMHRWKRSWAGYYEEILEDVCRRNRIPHDKPWKSLSRDQQKTILYGGGLYKVHWGKNDQEFEGVIPQLERRYKESESDFVKEEVFNRFMRRRTCPACKGARLKKESLAVTVKGKSIAQLCAMSVKEAAEFFSLLLASGPLPPLWGKAGMGGLHEEYHPPPPSSPTRGEENERAGMTPLTDRERLIAKQILKEIQSRLNFLVNVGLDYVTLDRESATLAGGEAQRIHLATQIGSGLVGVMYVLDEPTIGLHQRDNARLLQTLARLRDLGNTLLVVEHDEETMRAADWIVDLGPGAGVHGGEIVAEGPLKAILEEPRSLTGQYLKGKVLVPVPSQRREPDKRYLEILGAAQFNLKNIDIKVPLGCFVGITGVSGSGKSTFVHEILYKALAQKLYHSKEPPGKFRILKGIEELDKVIVVDQSPIGRTPRSNPATYTGAYSVIRDLFSQLPEARRRGYKPGRFSFNVKGGRCENCEGDGTLKISMQFLPDVYVKCEVCQGRRFNEETLQVRYKGRTISEVLAMPVEEALDFFKNIPTVARILGTLHDVGLGYIALGQSSTTLSGGEAQRVKLATELGKRATGRTLYILDEPTTGLHFADVHKLLDALHRLVSAGNTVLIIEHNLDVIKTADWIIDLGPEGGDAGGHIVAEGPPEAIVACPSSHTGKYLKPLLNR